MKAKELSEVKHVDGDYQRPAKALLSMQKGMTKESSPTFKMLPERAESIERSLRRLTAFPPVMATKAKEPYALKEQEGGDYPRLAKALHFTQSVMRPENSQTYKM
jgi:hypothetical protein